MRKSDEPLTDTLVRCLADPTDLKGLERLENDGDQAGASLMRCVCSIEVRPMQRNYSVRKSGRN